MKKINIKGAIVSDDDKWIYDMLEMEATSPKDVTEALAESEGKDIELTINSGGGDVYSASEIYTELRNHSGNVTSRIVGVAASAASVIAMAGKVVISPTAQIMIHKASTVGIGNSSDMKKVYEFLDTVDQSICNAYTHKTDLTKEEVLQLMSDETWMNADAAIEKGFADEKMFEEQKAVASTTGLLPEKAINLLRNSQNDSTITVEDIKGVVMEMKEDIVKELRNEIKPKEKPTNSWLF